MAKTLRVLKNLKTIVLSIAFIVMGGSVWAYDFVEGGIYYNITDAVNNYVEVTYSTSSYSSYADLDVVVPSTVTHDAITYTVTRVGANAFRRGSISLAHGVHSVVLPATITSIGSYAFANNNASINNISSLVSVNIPAAVDTIESYAFQNCTYLTEITLPDALISIGTYAFNGCSGITSITIPANVTTMGSSSVFVGCTALTSVTYNATNMTSPGSNSIWSATTNPCTLTIGAGVTQIPNNVFKGLLSNVTTIYFNATNCADFTSSNYSSKWTSLSSSCSVIFGNGVTRIPNYLFYQKVLANLTFGNALESIGDYAFGGASVPTSFNSLSGITVTIPSTLTSVGQNAFYKCQCDFSQIPSGVTTIGQYAFYNCVNMTCAVDLPNVTTIPTNAFYGTAITSVVIGQGVTTIGANAFGNCTAITNVTYNAANLTSPGSSNTIWGTPTNPCTLTIGPNVTTIPAYAFKGLSNVTAVNFNATNFTDYTSNSYVWPTFSSCVVTFGAGVTRIPNYLFNSCTGISSVSMGTAVTSIGTYAFNGCSNINTNVVIPNSVTTIGNRAFYGCTNMTGITIGTGVASIGTYAFRDCSSLASVVFNITSDSYTMPSSSYAFYGCSHECTLTIGAGVRRIPNYTFNGLSNITAINFNATNCVDNTDTTGDLLYSSIWSGKSVSCTLTFGAGVTNVPAFLFKGYTGLTSVSINNGVTTIGQYAFDGCTGIVSCNIPSSLTSIGTYAFNGCSNLESAIVIPSGVSVIPAYTFKGCAKISSVVIHDGVTTLGDYAFQNCTGMTSLTIGTGVATFGNSVFKGCTGLENIVFNVTSDSYTMPASTSNVFNGCTHECTLTIGAGVRRIPNNTFYGLSRITAINFNATNCVDNTTSGDLNYSNIWSDKSPTLYTTLTIGNNVTRIPAYLFDGFAKIQTFTMGTGVEEIGQYAFYGCTNLTGDIVIPDAVTTIPTYAFYGCSSITSITLGSGVTSLGASALQGCSGMTTFAIGEDFQTIGSNALTGCTGLTSVTFNAANMADLASGTYWGTPTSPCTLTIGPNVTRIPAYVFKGLLGNVTRIDFNATGCCDYTSGDYTNVWPSLSSSCDVVFGNGVTHVPDYLFYSKALASVTFGNALESIGEYAFAGTSSSFTSMNGFTITLPATLTTIEQDAFKNCKADFTAIPGTITSIGQEAFNGCSNISCTADLSGLTTIPSNIFYNCSSLSTVIIGENATSITANAFYGCTGITSVTYNARNMTAPSPGSNNIWGTPANPCTLTIGPNVTQIPTYVFKGLNNVGTINFNATRCCDYTSGTISSVWPTLVSCNVNIGSGVTKVPDYLFSGKSAVDTICIGNDVDTIGIYAFNGNSNAALLTMGNSVVSIGEYAFKGCSSFPNITLPTTLKTIGQYAFQNCASLTEVAIPDSVTVIPQYAFSGCSGLTSLTIGDNVTTIGQYAFQSCTALTSLTIGTGVTTFDTKAFTGCTGLNTVTFNAVNVTTVPTASNSYVFYNCATTNPIELNIGTDVAAIPNYMFKGITKIGTINYNATQCADNTALNYSNIWDSKTTSEVNTVLNIGGNVEHIPAHLFRAYNNLTEINMGDGVKSIGDYAFYVSSSGSSRLAGTTITLPATLTTVGDYAFRYCLADFELPSNISSIGQYAFANCNNMSCPVVLDNVASIPTYAFYYCSSVPSVIIGKNVSSIGNYAFAYCTGLKEVWAKRVTPVSLTSSNYVFRYVTTADVTLYYPKGSSYPTATVWRDFSPINAFYGFYTDGDWNVASKWTGNTVPDNTSLVLIEAKATIPSGCVAEADSLIMTNGSITIADGGQLVYDHDGITATVQKNIASALGKDESEHWYAIASPIGSVAIDTNLISGLYDLYRYDEPTMMWENYKAHEEFDTLENGRGYLYRNAANRTLAFTGALTAASVDYELTLSYNALPGFHLIANPFAHNISKGSAKAIDDDNLNTGFYTLSNNGAWQPQVDGTGIIAPCSAALVQANTEGTLTINKVYTASSAKGGADHDYLMFRVANSTYEDVAYAWFDDAVGLTKIEHRNANIPMLYINNADGDYAIATMGEGTKSFNLSFKTSTMGKYTLTANANGQFGYLHIFDRFTGADVDMLINNEYAFVGSSADIENRFIVRLSPDATIDEEVFAYQIGSDLIVSGNGELQVFDVAGRLVSRQQINGIETWNASSVQTGVYILRLVGNDVKTQKIVIR